MASRELQGVVAMIACERAKAGLVDHAFDVAAARAALGPVSLKLPEDTTVKSAETRKVRAEWFAAPQADTRRRIVYLHGDGYVSGGLPSHRALAAWLSHHSGCVVLFVQYRLAPEHCFPADLNDACEALCWASENGPDGPRAPDEVFVGGDSAGAGLAVAALLRRRDEGKASCNKLFLLCGMFNCDERTAGFVAGLPRIQQMVRAYFERPEDLVDRLASPVLADLRGLPPPSSRQVMPIISSRIAWIFMPPPRRRSSTQHWRCGPR
jgi:acetyl esterase